MASDVHASAQAVQRRVASELMARVGAFALAGVLALPLALPAASPVSLVAALGPGAAGGPFAADAAIDALVAEAPSHRRGMTVARGEEWPLRVAAAQSDGDAAALDTAGGQLATEMAPPPPIPFVDGATVLASWYGPGFYGDRTACGVTFSAEVLGVAHRTLPCGTRVVLTSPAGRSVTATVIDRGPYVGGRALDLSPATKLALACGDLCLLRVALAP